MATPRIVLVHRRTELQELLDRHATRGQAEFFLNTRGRSIQDVQDRHDRLTAALATVREAVPSDWRQAEVERADLSRFLLTAEDIKRAFSAFAADRPDGLIVLTEQRSMLHAKLLAELSRRERLPVLHSFSEGVHAGGIISYGPHQLEMVSIATSYVAKILKGAKPAELPVEQPTRFELVINLKTAKEIGLTVPPTLLARADEVIE